MYMYDKRPWLNKYSIANEGPSYGHCQVNLISAKHVYLGRVLYVTSLEITVIVDSSIISFTVKRLSRYCRNMAALYWVARARLAAP